VLERTSPESRRTFALAKDARGAVTAIVADGRELPLGRRLDGWVESTERRDGSVRITGWAADVTNRKLASEVVAFHRDRPIASGGTWVAKGYVAEGLGEPAYTLSGFQLDAPAASVAGLEAEGVRVFAISDDGNATELGRLFLRLERDGGAEHLVRSDGVRVPVKGGALDGVTEAVEPDAAGTLLKGWCADRSRALPADRVVVTLDDRVVREAAPSEERPDLAPPGGPTLRCGFRLHFDVRPAEALGALESGRARLFGVTSAQTATELRAAPGYGKPAK
jgi:hypothetical protein